MNGWQPWRPGALCLALGLVALAPADEQRILTEFALGPFPIHAGETVQAMCAVRGMGATEAARGTRFRLVLVARSHGWLEEVVGRSEWNTPDPIAPDSAQAIVAGAWTLRPALVRGGLAALEARLEIARPGADREVHARTYELWAGSDPAAPADDLGFDPSCLVVLTTWDEAGRSRVSTLGRIKAVYRH